MMPSAVSRMRSAVSWRTPVLASTGRSGQAALASSRSAKRKAEPARGPEINAASQPKNWAPCARSATVREPSGEANSGVRLVRTAMSSAPIEWRYENAAPGSGRSWPMSLSYTPIKTSRTKRAPTARPTASVANGSHSMSTPIGFSRSGSISPITAAIAVDCSIVTSTRYGRSPSLQKMIASTPASWQTSASCLAASTIGRMPAVRSKAGEPGSASRWTTPISGLATPKMRAIASSASVPSMSAWYARSPSRCNTCHTPRR